MADITPRQCRAARQVLGWHQRDLHRAAQVAEATIMRFEKGQHLPKPTTLLLLRLALEKAGIVFLDGEPGREGITWKL